MPARTTEQVSGPERPSSALTQTAATCGLYASQPCINSGLFVGDVFEYHGPLGVGR